MENLEQKIMNKLIQTMDLTNEDIEEFNYDSPIFEKDAQDDEITLGLDSVDALELVVMIYDEWGIDVPAEDMSSLKTINLIAEYIRKAKGE